VRPLSRYSTSPRRTVPVLGVAALIAPLLGGLGAVDRVTGDLAAVVDTGVLADGRALVHVVDGADLDAVAADLSAAGATVRSSYEAIEVIAVGGGARVLAAVADLDGVERLERDAPIELLMDTSHTATRGAELLDGSVTVGGEVVDGRGVGVAVVDSGVDEIHPDLAGQVGENVKVLPGGLAVPLPITDTASLGGHGTHVAGTVNGTGAASGGSYHGAAPGATVHSVSAGAFISVAFALDGLEWVLDNHAAVSPAIRVVNNSWGSSGEHDPDGATTQMVDALVAEGLTVVFAAGNSGVTVATSRPAPSAPTPPRG
jgi:serine protease AprX